MRSALLLLPLLLLCQCGEQGDISSEQQQSSAVPVATELQQTADFCGMNSYIHCKALCDMGPRPSGSEAYTRQLHYLSKHLTAAGWSVHEEPFKLTNGTKMVNLHAVMGTDDGTRPIIITCHIDTKIGISPNFVGADDGASAAAVIIELARVLKSHPKAGAVELIFFDGEEAFARNMSRQDGLYGSRYDVARRQGKLPRYQINLDMVGGRNKTIAVPLLDSSPDLLAHYEQAVAALGYSERRWSIHPGSYLDDHIPYEEAGVETLNLIADFTNSNWWHTDKDNMSRICPKSLEESGRLVLQLLSQLTAENKK